MINSRTILVHSKGRLSALLALALLAGGLVALAVKVLPILPVSLAEDNIDPHFHRPHEAEH